MQTYAEARRTHASAHASEPDYNMGRALQHLGLDHLAVASYENVLNAALVAREGGGEGGGGGGEGGGGGGEGGGEAQDLVREAAHNLTRMCHASGAHELARALTRSFNTV